MIAIAGFIAREDSFNWNTQRALLSRASGRCNPQPISPQQTVREICTAMSLMRSIQITSSFLAAFLMFSDPGHAANQFTCSTYSPSYYFNVSKKEIVFGQYGVASQQRSKIIARPMSKMFDGAITLRSWSKSGGIGYMIIKRSSQCSEQTVDPNGNFTQFFYVD